MVLHNKDRLRNRVTGIATLVMGLLAAGSLQAADFDCKLAVTKIEKLICSDATVSQLDADLGVAYRNRSLWDYNKLNYWYHGDDRHENIGSYNKWKAGYKAAQRRWLKEVRNACTTTDCLVKAYRARITDINGQQAPLPSFRLSRNDKPQLCTAMLEVLNRTPREQLGACTRHDYSGSPFTPVLSEAPIELRQPYEQKLQPHGTPPFAERWSAIANRYASGQRKLIGQQANVDGDGKPEWLLEVSYPSYKCEGLPASSEQEMLDRDRNNTLNWRILTDTQQLDHAKEHGWISSVSLLKDDVLHDFDGFGQLLRFQQYWVILQQSMMYYKHSPDTLKHHIKLRVLPMKPDVSDGNWIAEENCSFWYNY